MLRFVSTVVTWAVLASGCSFMRRTPAKPVAPNPPPWLDERITSQANQAAPKLTPVGDIRKGVAKEVDDTQDWQVQLDGGRCYLFSGLGDDGVEGLSLYLYNEQGTLVTKQHSSTASNILRACIESSGLHRLRAKSSYGRGHMGVGVFAQPVEEKKKADLEKKKKAEKNSVETAQADGNGSNGRAATTTASVVVGANGACDGKDEEGSSSFVVGCDCGALELYVDGQNIPLPMGSASARVDELAPGCHNIKIVAWTGLFSRDTWFDGKVKLPANYEARYQVSEGKLELVGKSKLAPPAPQLDREALSDASDYVKEATEYNEDEESRCQAKMAGKLEALTDMLAELRDGNGDLDKTVRKLEDARAFAEEECPARVSNALGKKLRKARDRLSRQS